MSRLSRQSTFSCVPRYLGKNVWRLWLTWGRGGGVLTLGPLGHFSFYHIFTHIHAMVLIYISKRSRFNMLSNGMFYLPIHAF